MKAGLGTVVAMALLVPAVLLLIQDNPGEIPGAISIEKHSRELVQINQESKEYQMAGDMQKFEDSKRSMKEKLKEASLSHMGLEISSVDLVDGYYPFEDSDTKAERLGLEPSSVCASFEQSIPLHMQKISQTENFGLFAEKYSQYGIELYIMDERDRVFNNTHYGLSAADGNGRYAATWFHMDSCTGERTDKESYFLICGSDDNRGGFSTSNYKDIVASYLNSHFCEIELDPWRQSLREYSEMLREQRLQFQRETLPGLADAESHMEFFSEMNRRDDLGGIVGNMIQGKFDEQVTQDMIKRYESQHGGLPGELQELIRNRT